MNETLEAIRVMGLWRVIWCHTGYRPFQRLAHRFNWHHMYPMPIIEKDRQQIWCQWCGARYTRYIGPPIIPTQSDAAAK
jgi:hypothetical protein